ncbi:GNAT family N-acetyltransferase [Methanocella sp. CWC-04]|uniref:GNAT family N-acetyltransferase n=1 Tax=Methanooceanicella nereidis TaxID=2052831 RepID=A0AAP2RB91_9EURY|nr:N-acetyltransferase [Methanocella sp. CWC-04]MCD1293721.1 GNAT family N-acetyltransferase [Methanocella sp. CWC-04]
MRSERPDDFAAIYEVNLKAFGQDKEPKLVDDLRASGNFIPDLSIVAIKDGKIVGHILFCPLTIETEKGRVPALTLAPLAVLPEYQGQGIGSGLTMEGLKRCKALGHRIVIVVGHPGYYPRFGFTSARAKGLDVLFPVPDEAFMAIELVPGALDGMKGMVIFPPEFNIPTEK